VKDIVAAKTRRKGFAVNVVSIGPEDCARAVRRPPNFENQQKKVVSDPQAGRVRGEAA
jgi:hypothetical protein